MMFRHKKVKYANFTINFLVEKAQVEFEFIKEMFQKRTSENEYLCIRS